MPKHQVIDIHFSDIPEYKRCRQAWSWSSPLRANLTPRAVYPPYFVGNLVHYCLTERYRGDMCVNDAIIRYFASELTTAQLATIDVAEHTELVKGLMAHYALWQRYDTTSLADKRFRFVALNQSFRIPLWRNARITVYLNGAFDGIVYSVDDGKYYLWEIKTARSINERSEQLELDSQLDTYLAMANCYYPISGIIYTLIRKKVPNTPKPLKSGMLSQALDQDTTAVWYLNEIKKQHFNGSQIDKVLIKQWIKDHYATILNHLAANDNKYFKRQLVTRTVAELDNAWQQLVDVTKEMISSKTAIYRSEDKHCANCFFRYPCITKRANGNYQAILDANYEQNMDTIGE